MKFIIHETDNCAWANVNGTFVFGKDVAEISKTFDMYAEGSDYDVVTDALAPDINAEDFFA